MSSRLHLHHGHRGSEQLPGIVGHQGHEDALPQEGGDQVHHGQGDAGDHPAVLAVYDEGLLHQQQVDDLVDDVGVEVGEEHGTRPFLGGWI